MRRTKKLDLFLVGYILGNEIKRHYYKTYAHTLFQCYVEFRENPKYNGAEIVSIELINVTEV